jgi:hypothetical protein
MIKALLLIFDPIATWERIVVAQRRWPFILLGYVLPLLGLSCLAEGYGLMRWGKTAGEIPHVRIFSQNRAVAFESAQLILGLLVIFLGARLIK